MSGPFFGGPGGVAGALAGLRVKDGLAYPAVLVRFARVRYKTLAAAPRLRSFCGRQSAEKKCTEKRSKRGWGFVGLRVP